MERLSLSAPYNAIEFAIHAIRYAPLRQLVKGRRVLDISCGEGLGTQIISRWGAATVTGVDISAEAINAASSRLTHDTNIDFVCSDAYDYLEQTRQGEFDVIVSIETIEHLPDPKRFLTLCKRALAVDGVLLVSCPNDTFYYGGGSTMNRFHQRSYSFDEFRAMSEELLGQGSWSLGTMLSGFALVPLAQLDSTSENYAHALGRRKPLFGDAVGLPPNSAEALRPETSIFYVGMWGGDPQAKNLAVSLPTGADFRMRDVRSVSQDVSLGFVRRLAIIHDSDVRPEELAALSKVLEGKYVVEAIEWDGVADSLVDRLLRERPGFDNLHFESEEALAASMAEIDRRATDPRFLQEGSAWAAATITVRPRTTALSERLHNTADGVFPRSAEMPTLWSAGEPEDLTEDSLGVPLGKRVGVVAFNAADRNKFATVIVPLIADRTTADLRCTLLEATGWDAAVASQISKLDVLICLSDQAESRRVVEEALCRGLPVILPVSHPHAPLLGEARSEFVLANMDLPSMRRAFNALYHKPDITAKARRAGVALCGQMATPSRGIAWTRAFAIAQQAHNRTGGALRLERMRTRGEVYQDIYEAFRRDNSELRTECDRLRREQITTFRLISDLTDRTIGSI